ncbi:MAG: DEAD/DEAH box helicase [Planctomycetes bacterium]|nr:DEAD/DEAH box helicase [Planctomycetota bacterium]
MDSASDPGRVSFASLGLSEASLRAIAAMGFDSATAVQAATIPPIMAGRDVIGQSETGSGKTAAFCIPAIERIDPRRQATQVLILVPTRELATQVAGEVRKLAGESAPVRSFAVYGGAAYEPQFAALRRGVHILVGTPGRLVDHLARGTLDLSAVGMVVLDEADRMLDMGFREDIEKVLAATPAGRQTVFFSATLSPEIRGLVAGHSRDAESVSVGPRSGAGPAAVEQIAYEVPHRAKLEALARLLDFHAASRGVIFCNTQQMVEELADALAARGCPAERLHGGMAQPQRTRVMNAFKKGAFPFLVATDVAARGIDVDDLGLVVNYDMPYDAEDYVHRIGRTGRAGRAGLALTLVSGGAAHKLQLIERALQTRIRRERVPTAAVVEARRAERLLDRLRAMIAGGGFRGRLPIVDRLVGEGHSPAVVAAAILEHFAPSTSPSPAADDAMFAPPRGRHVSSGGGPRRPPRTGGRHPAGRPAKAGRPTKAGRPGKPHGRPAPGPRGKPRRPKRLSTWWCRAARSHRSRHC